MPLYNLTVLVLHYPTYAPLRTLVHTAASLVRTSGGLVRKIEYMGKRNTPQRVKAPTIVPGGVPEADYWTMTFDANPPTVKELGNRLRVDPRVLRHTTLKMGTRLPQVAQPRWNRSMQEGQTVSQADKNQIHEQALNPQLARPHAVRPS